MVNIKEIKIKVARVLNYQSVTFSEKIEIEQGDNIEQIKKESFKRCNDICKECLNDM